MLMGQNNVWLHTGISVSISFYIQFSKMQIKNIVQRSFEIVSSSLDIVDSFLIMRFVDSVATFKKMHDHVGNMLMVLNSVWVHTGISVSISLYSQLSKMQIKTS